MGTESLTNQAFDIYRDGEKIYTTGGHDATCYTDSKGTADNKYTVVPKGEAIDKTEAVDVWTTNTTYKGRSVAYKDIAFKVPDGGKTPTDEEYTYTANDMSVGDLDGDGEYEYIVKWDPSNSKDNSVKGYTGNVYLDAYELDGTLLWRIDLGVNIRAGAHYTQYMVYDFDGDGKSEVILKTAPGSKDGEGNYVSKAGKNITKGDDKKDYRNSSGLLMGEDGGPEYLTVFNGETGAAMQTVDFDPPRSILTSSEWGDSYANRSERYLAAVAYLDGIHPSIVMCRGYYHDSVIRAYTWDGTELTMQWEHKGKKSESSTTLYGQGNHNLSVGDIDNDGKEECPVPDYLTEYLEKYHETLMESVAETSEEFMDRYFEGDTFSVAEISAAIATNVQDGSIVPVCMGSPVNLRGVSNLLDDICGYFPSPSGRSCNGIAQKTNEIFEANYDFAKAKSAYVFKTIADPFLGKYSLIRLEHPAMLIDQIQYHNKNGRGKYLPAAEYSFVTQAEGRGVYSFCMCPGGFIVPAASGPEQVVVNGMSPANRGSRWSNSGMVVEIQPEDLGNEELKMRNEELAAQQDEQLMALNPNLKSSQLSEINSQLLSVLHFQEELERQCWLQGGRRQTAPAQRMLDFTRKKLSYDLPESSYSPGLISSPLHFWMPSFISKRLSLGFQQFGRSSHGFLTNEAVMIGVETRTSSPVRIIRDKDTLQHVTVRGLFPCGEGAGYAGGIVSAGVDGERCAEAVANYFNH